VTLNKELETDQTMLAEIQKKQPNAQGGSGRRGRGRSGFQLDRIPLARMMESDVQKLLHMDERLKCA
jgi:ATP-dependent Clp protease ATP-binding subunit ClpB